MTVARASANLTRECAVRWAVEEAFRAAKNETAIDHDPARTPPAVTA
jgi:hypothetical protein